jgi:hypothetical protein
VVPWIRVSAQWVSQREVRLRGLERLETQALQRCSLRVADARFHFAFAIGIADAARQGHDAVVGEHVAIQRIEDRIVDVRRQHALFEVIEDDHLHRAAKPTEGAFVQLTPDLRTRPPCQQPGGFARIRQREDKPARAPVLARGRRAHHRPVAVINLPFFTRRRGDDDAPLGRRPAPQLRDESPHAGVAGAKAVVIDQVLPNGDGVATPGECLGNQLAIRLAGAGARRARRGGVGGHLGDRNGRFGRKVGGHLLGNCRFWRTFAWPPRPRTGIPAARRYPPIVTRWTPVASAMRLSVQPRRPSARTSCCLSWSKTLLMSARDYTSVAFVNVSAARS